ncbi:unnamed protein product [Mycena citricolor]|uniref:Uncharacterized protein n=1 Tax=Mycena citricolor TaxID=2018698 RepID=A0AAD2H8A5_9AGAR|nr:unnamed protein product [Mycena citricolor]CAK5269267.1 unnamed protein product [Mycena citricolor]
MRFTSFISLALVAPLVSASVLPRSVSSKHGVINAPTAGTVVAAGSSFPFSYQDSNWCQSGYSPISVWLTDSAPTTASINATDGSLLSSKHYYGRFLIANFGLPSIGNPPPPASLTLPALPASQLPGSSLYVVVVETGNGCPPGNVPAQYAVTSKLVVFA